MALDGVPNNPAAWLISAGRFKAIDALRRRKRFETGLPGEPEMLGAYVETPVYEETSVVDDRLRLIFTCCHPALPADAQTALTLREVCGLTTEEIASAFFTSPATMAQRIVRAQAKIRDARSPYEVPERDGLPGRLDAVLRVVYLVYNEGYTASSGESLTRVELSMEAIRLGRLLAEILPEPEVLGLLALMLLHESRRQARLDEAGELVLLENQDRSQWNRAQIDEGKQLLERALLSRRFGPIRSRPRLPPYDAPASPRRIGARLSAYMTLLRLEPTVVVELNRVAALAMRDGPLRSAALDAIFERDELKDYHRRMPRAGSCASGQDGSRRLRVLLARAELASRLRAALSERRLGKSPGTKPAGRAQPGFSRPILIVALVARMKLGREQQLQPTLARRNGDAVEENRGFIKVNRIVCARPAP